MVIHSKLPHVGMSIFSRMSQLALACKAINLGQGFPDFDPPPMLRDALSRAMSIGLNQYAPSIGFGPLREQIAAKTERLYGRKTDSAREVTVTSGATEALFCVIAALVDRGDEVIVFDPAYDSYEPAIHLQGAKAIHVPLSLPDFTIDWQSLSEALSARTRMIVFNTPHNPSGSVFRQTDLEKLADLIRDTSIMVLSDEVYEHIVYDGRQHQSVLGHAELADRSLVVSSFGKTYHCTGWKLGYVIAPPELSNELRKVHQYLTFCSFHPAQYALAEFMSSAPEHYLELSDFYQAKRDRFHSLLETSRFKLLDVAGGYFQLADYAAIRDDLDDVAFCEWLALEKGVAAIPLSPFYQVVPKTSLVRFCFAKNDHTLVEAAERLCKL